MVNRPAAADSMPRISSSVCRRSASTSSPVRTIASPAAVGATPRGPRKKSVVRSRFSSSRTATLSVGWLTRSCRAAAVKLPQAAIART